MTLLLRIAPLLALVFAAVGTAQPLPGEVPCLVAGYTNCGSLPRAVPDETVVYDTGRAGADRLLDVFYDERAPAVARPALILVHGGAWEIDDQTRFGTRAQQFATGTGWVVFNVDYDTTAPGRWENLPRDIAAAVRWTHDTGVRDYAVDAQRIALLGESAGGHLALLEALRPGDPGLRVAAVVSWVGITDLPGMVAYAGCPETSCSEDLQASGAMVQDYVGDCPATRTACNGKQVTPCFLTVAPACPARYAEGSPLTQVDEDDPPVQLQASSADNVVPFSQALALERALRDAGVPVDCVRSDGRGHATPSGAVAQSSKFLRATFGEGPSYAPRSCV